MVPALRADHLVVGVVQVEVARELIRARLTRIATVSPLLLGGEKEDRASVVS